MGTKGFSYKEMLTNQLMVFINQRIATSKDMQDKVNALSDEKKKKFQKKIVDSIINKAKSLAEIQGTQYLGMMGDSGEQEMLSWVDAFFDDFEEHMKEPEKPKKTAAPVTATKQKNKKFKFNDGMFGIEIILSKKEILTKEEFESKIKKENKGSKVEFVYENGEVEVVTKEEVKKETKKEVKKEAKKEAKEEKSLVEIEEEQQESVEPVPEETEEETEEETQEETQEAEEETEEDEDEDYDLFI